MKFFRFRRTLCALTVASAFLISHPYCFGDQAESDSTTTPRRIILETPTVEDRALATRFQELFSQLDQPQGVACEVTNSARSNDAATFIKAMQSSEPIDARVLRRGRGLLGWLTPQLEAAKTITPPAPFPVAQKRGSIVIDGKLDEKTWGRAAEMTLKYKGANAFEGPAARAKLLWDEKYFYLGYTVPDTNIVAPLLKRDDPVWEYDCVELFLLPNKRFGLYWELEIGATGSIVDYLGYKNPNQWGGDLRTTETVNGLQIGRTIRGTANNESDRDEGYTVEIAVPWNEVPGMARGPQKGDTIYALLGWIDRETAAQSTSTARAQVPFVGWFHNIWCYQPLVFSSDNKLP